MTNKYLIFTIAIITIFLLIFSGVNKSSAQTEQLPEDVFENLKQGSKPIGETFWQTIKTEFPKMIKRPWQDALTAWKMIFNWIKGFWNSYLSNWVKIVWDKLVSFLGKEVEKKKPEIQDELKKETEEMKQDIPETAKTLKSFWQRLKDIVQ